MIDQIAALLLQAIEQQCEESGGIVLVRSDDLTSVELEGAFDIRGLALTLLANMPKEVETQDPSAPNAHVSVDSGGFLQIRLAGPLT